MTSDSLERAELLDLEVEVVAMLLRRLPCKERQAVAEDVAEKGEECPGKQ